MKRFAFVVLLLAAACGAQTLDVNEHRGSTVGEKLTAAQAACSPSITCVLVLKPELAALAAGTLPARCATCVWNDYRTNPPSIVPALANTSNTAKATAGTTFNVWSVASSDATNPIRLRVDETGSATPGSRGWGIQSVEDNVANRNLWLNPNGGRIGAQTATVPQGGFDSWDGLSFTSMSGMMSITGDPPPPSGTVYGGYVMSNFGCSPTLAPCGWYAYTGGSSLIEMAVSAIAAESLDPGDIVFATAPSGSQRNTIQYARRLHIHERGDIGINTALHNLSGFTHALTIEAGLLGNYGIEMLQNGILRGEYRVETTGDIGVHAETGKLQLYTIANKSIELFTGSGLRFYIDGATGNVVIPALKSNSGTRFLCIDSTGNVISQISACSGT